MMWNDLNQQLFTQQYTQTFSSIYPTYEDFLSDYNNLGIPKRLKETNGNAEFLETIYVLLMGEYANSSIMALSEGQFRLRLFTLIMSYGPQYERELDMQNTLLNMSDEELQVSSKVIYNSSFNPSEAPTTDTMDELTTINQQNVSKHKRSKLNAYEMLMGLLDADLTKNFIKRFDRLFVRILRTNQPLYYTTEVDE